VVSTSHSIDDPTDAASNRRGTVKASRPIQRAITDTGDEMFNFGIDYACQARFTPYRIGTRE